MRFHVPLMRVYSWFIYYKGIQGGEFQSFSKIVWRKVGLNSVPLASVKATEASIEATRTAKQGLELTKEMSQLDQRPWLAPIYIEGSRKPISLSRSALRSGIPARPLPKKSKSARFVLRLLTSRSSTSRGPKEWNKDQGQLVSRLPRPKRTTSCRDTCLTTGRSRSTKSQSKPSDGRYEATKGFNERIKPRAASEGSHGFGQGGLKM